ncbi:hypothetical protein MNBD_CHLOROFLEXI01-290 [hydrothermal vent metagenome]|uniref:Abortive phage resistance protein n=1 Tax=hydrothermal vent metagenome TaxID=652676 RepID=A0A3B0VUF9_9ZZZZ
MSRIKKPNGRNRLQRTVEHKLEVRHFLIVCEGGKTEPNYFKKFPQPQNGSITVRGMGANTDSLVELAIVIRADIEREKRQKFTDVWCVFDRDSFPAQNFNRALELAEINGIEVAYTNEAFELWYLLHFDYHDTGVSRHDYRAKLSASNRLSFKYEKNNPDMYDILLERQPAAIQNAKTLFSTYGRRPNPEKSSPITRVHLLVWELNKAARKKLSSK